MILTLTYFSSGGGRGPCPGHQRQRPGAPEPATQHQRERRRGHTHFSGQSSCTGCRQRPQRAAHLQHHRRQPGWRFLRQRHSKRRAGRGSRTLICVDQTFQPQSKQTSGLALDLCICRQTGVVQVNRPLDRERVAEYRLTITVKDNPENPRIARRVTSLPRVQPLQTFTHFLFSSLNCWNSWQQNHCEPPPLIERIYNILNIIFRVWKSFFFFYSCNHVSCKTIKLQTHDVVLRYCIVFWTIHFLVQNPTLLECVSVIHFLYVSWCLEVECYGWHIL